MKVRKVDKIAILVDGYIVALANYDGLVASTQNDLKKIWTNTSNNSWKSIIKISNIKTVSLPTKGLKKNIKSTQTISYAEPEELLF